MELRSGLWVWQTWRDEHPCQRTGKHVFTFLLCCVQVESTGSGILSFRICEMELLLCPCPHPKDLQYGLAEIMSRPVEILGSCTCPAYHQSKATHFIHYLRTCMPYLAKCLPCHRQQIATEHYYCTCLNISWITWPSHQKHFLSRIST